MTKLTQFINLTIKFRWAIAILIPLLTIALSIQLKDLAFNGSFKIWFADDSTAIVDNDYFRATFGNDDSVIISFEDPNGVMNKKALETIDRLTDKLWKTKNIVRVDSLTNYQYVHASKIDPDEILVEDFIEDISALTPQELKEKAAIAITEDMLVNKIISSDGKTTIITGRISQRVGEDVTEIRAINDAVVAYVKEESERSGYKFYLAGGPILNTAFVTLGIHDATTFTPIVIVLIMVLLFFIFKRASGMFLSISIVVFTFLIVLSIQVMLGYKLNNFTANMPIFVMAIGIADAMHLFWIYLIGRRKGLDNHEAIHYTVEKNFLPIFLTSLTTAVGFASLGISEIIPIKTLGIATANAALLAFVLTIVFVPAMLAIINPKIRESEMVKEEDQDNHFSKKYAKFIIRHDIKIIIASIIVFGGMGLGLAYVKVDSNTVRYFREDVGFRQTVNFIETKISGPMSYEIVIDSQERDGIKEPEFMNKVIEFSDAFKEKYPAVRHTTSLVDVVKKFSEVMDGKKEVPESKNHIAQYLLLYSLSLPQGMEINDKMDIDERLLRLTVSLNVVNTSLDIKMIQWCEDWWKETKYGAKVYGQTQMFAHMQNDVTDTLLQSIILAISVVSIIMFFIFKNVRMIPLFIIPNVLPIVLVVGVMGWIGITIDIGVAISGAIIIGVAVDDTIHFLVKYKEARLKGYNFEDSLSYIMQYAGSAIIFTTIILSMAFTVFSFSQFIPNVNFGIVTAIALVIAVAVDLIMLPAVLSRYDGKDKSFLSK